MAESERHLLADREVARDYSVIREFRSVRRCRLSLQDSSEQVMMRGQNEVWHEGERQKLG